MPGCAAPSFAKPAPRRLVPAVQGLRAGVGRGGAEAARRGSLLSPPQLESLCLGVEGGMGTPKNTVPSCHCLPRPRTAPRLPALTPDIPVSSLAQNLGPLGNFLPLQVAPGWGGRNTGV